MGAEVATQNYPPTPQDKQHNAQKRSRRPWLGLVAVLLVLVLITGGVFVIKEAFATQQPPATPTPVVHTTPTVTPTATSAPSPTPTPTLSPSQQATAVVQNYYDDINNHNYQAAYNLLGSNFQSSHPYNQFASGYANTVHDNLATGTVTAQSDGTFNVPATVIATEDNTSGTGYPPEHISRVLYCRTGERHSENFKRKFLANGITIEVHEVVTQTRAHDDTE